MISRRNKKIARGILSAVALLSFCAASPAQEAGKREYMIACGGCHGESGMGKGPFNELLNIEAPGLTGLAAANDGVFPYLEVFMIVDGRTGVRGHSGGDMPIWGERFSSTAQEEFGFFGAEIVTRGRIAVLVDYIESIQQ